MLRQKIFWMLLWPGITLCSAFLPWFQVVVPHPGTRLDMVQLSPDAWGWVVVNIGALFLVRWRHTGRWVWSLLGIAALGGGVATGFSFATAARVSQLLSAPVPLIPDWGFAVFLAGALGWACVAGIWMLSRREPSIDGPRA
ncbi:hypothetical protein [Sulfobacillus harzensis]|uniref:Uncharacterized protein n=1 Tax=Sulfobacillus harzensis TaxID=2729629 RepID=A0A7Y0Q4A5_9FIRM|nr:hypothetical protein [Sulfobacillus harzensis]NMP23791.1 hypothetical protein [Sulfobacillus harzensis]